MPIDLICLDADDTLWHKMRHFNAAEGALLAIIAFAGTRWAERGDKRDGRRVLLAMLGLILCAALLS